MLRPVEATPALEWLAGIVLDWTTLDSYLLDYCVSPEMRKTVRASSFASALELVREGKIELRQDRAFAPLYVRSRPRSAPNETPDEQAA